MKEKTRPWFELASRDLASAKILGNEEYTLNTALFHCQQAVEKLLKAILEEFDKDVPKIHSTVELIKRIPKNIRDNIAINIEDLKAIDEIYIDTRYPSEIGILPHGYPTKEDFQYFYNLVEKLYKNVVMILKEE